MRHPIGQTKSGVAVYVDLIGSPAAKHIAEQPYLLGLVKEALRQTSVKDEEISIEHDMGRVVGYDFVVSTTEKDTIFYAQLLRDATYTRFVKNGEPHATQQFTFVLRRNDKDGTYDLHDTWIGSMRPMRPGSTNETAESRSYWANHAVVLTNQTIQPRTVTRTCPY